jgi:lipopolysaccharide transport system ATP-binding protein
VSHNLSALQRLCPTSILFEKGRIVAHGPTNDVIAQYLRHVVTSTSDCLDWRRSAPAHSAAWFDRAFIANMNGEPVSTVATGEQFKVGLEFTVREPIERLQVSIGILNGDTGEQIFGSAPQDSGLEPPTTPGRYRASVELPKDLFMARDYAIRTSLWTPEGGSIDWRDALTFTAVQTQSLSNSTPGGRAGLIALRCDWSLQRVADAAPSITDSSRSSIPSRS